ncbi:MAG: Rpn family recombination-promoting nuclease/putative transposase [Spirochaetales bacterium]|nr:Rpn family recombination-promoting nuclease/putative transposase [Spirochaetales bacterium]
MKKRTSTPLDYMNPKVDFAFKYVFGNPDYPEITISLLNAVLSLPLDKQIVKVRIANPTLGRRTQDDKYSVMDIRAIANDNTHINIEMQIANKGDMIPRTLHYMSRMISDQLKSGMPYSELQQAICINFLDFELFHSNKNIHNVFRYRNENNEILTNLTQIHFVELPKIKKDGIIDNEMLKNWVNFINDPKSKEVDLLICEHAEINKARNILSMSNLKQRILQKYYDRQDRLLEKNSWEAYGKRQKEAGFAEGSHSKAIETAHNLLQMGLSKEQVAQGTGLSLSEIQDL